MLNPNYVQKSRNTARVLIALVFAALATQSLPGATKSKIGAFGSGYWVLDQNGNNTWDGPPADGVPLWSTGDSREIAVYGDWNGDGRTKMGVYLDGVWILDYNGNGVWDGPDVDKVFTFGDSDYLPIVGDWNHTGWTKIGIHGISNMAKGHFLLDYNGNFRWDDPTVDRSVYWSLGILTGEIAVIGDWNGDGRGDKIGIYSDGYWVLDYNGNNAWEGTSVDRDVYWSIDSHDIPVVGNWNGLLNSTKIGVYSDGYWMADYNGNFILDGQTRFAFFGGGNSTFLPAVGDWNDDGKTKIAAYLITSGTWWIEKSGNWLWDGPSIDVYTSFGGSTYVKPIVGAWSEQLTSNSFSPIGGNASSGTFTAVFTDLAGVNDIDAVQIAFSTSSAAPNTYQGCHLIYSKSLNILLLESAAGNNMYPYSSNLGSGGQALSNGICVVDSAQTTVTASNNFLTLVVPIVFTPSSTTTFWAYTSLTTVTQRNNGWTRFGSWFLQPLPYDPQCTGISPFVGDPSAPMKFTTSGVIYATSVTFLIQKQSEALASSHSYAGTAEGGGAWKYTVTNSADLALGSYKVTAKLNGKSTVYCPYPAFYTIRLSYPADPGIVPCNSLAGDWTDSLNNGMWSLQQGTSVSGTFKATYPAYSDGGACPLTTWNAAGPTPASGQFNLSATNPIPASGVSSTGSLCQPATSFTESGTFGPACASATGQFLGNGSISSANFTWARSPTLPDGETSSFLGWQDAFGMPTMSRMKALLSSTQKFGGRSVIETSPILGSDTCYFTASIFEKSQNVTGGTWYVQNDNTYQTDYVGPFPDAVGFYQTYGPPKWGGGDHSVAGCPGTGTSCSICINQQMQMSTPSGFQNYGSPNLLQITITQTEVTASRANATGNRTYSFQ